MLSISELLLPFYYQMSACHRNSTSVYVIITTFICCSSNNIYVCSQPTTQTKYGVCRPAAPNGVSTYNTSMKIHLKQSFLFLLCKTDKTALSVKNLCFLGVFIMRAFNYWLPLATILHTKRPRTSYKPIIHYCFSLRFVSQTFGFKRHRKLLCK